MNSDEYWEKLEATGMAYVIPVKVLVTVAFREGQQRGNTELLAALEKILADVDRPGGSVRTVTPDSIANARTTIKAMKS